MKSILAGSAAFVLLACVAVPASADIPPGHDRVCLITFDDDGGRANTDVVSAKYLPRKAADAQNKAADDNVAIFTYSAVGDPATDSTEATCACLDDPATRAGCEGDVTGSLE